MAGSWIGIWRTTTRTSAPPGQGRPILRIYALCVLLVLAGCATTIDVDPSSALSGKELDAATAIYGNWEQRLTLAGRPTYIWRRELIEGESRYYCELMVETGFRQIISHSYMQGYPAACRLFNVRYDKQ